MSKVKMPRGDVCTLGPHADDVDFSHSDRQLLAYAEERVREALSGTWKSIDTAPKDGTEILLYGPATVIDGREVAERVTSGSWIEWEEKQSEYHNTTGEYLGETVVDDGASWMSWDGGFTEEHPPTHWQPMPLPPI